MQKFPSWSGRLKSIWLISLENLVTIRPIGVVSKNDVGPRRTFTSRSLWIFDPALREHTRRVRELTKLTSAGKGKFNLFLLKECVNTDGFIKISIWLEHSQLKEKLLKNVNIQK